MLAADSVAINRLQIKGDKRTSQALIRELEQTSWAKPLPMHLQHAWILVRELTVKGKARELRQQTAHHLDSELQHAVRAIQGNPESANVIWFASLPELIAFLLADLALGKMTQWYWSRWAYLLKYPGHEAIARLLCENIDYIPAIITQLQSRKQLSLVISQISSGGALTLVRELARVRGFQDPVFWQQEPSVLMTVSRDIYQQVISHQKLLAYWRPVLQGLDIQDGRVLLAVVLYGLAYAPLWLQQQPAVLMKAVASILCPVSAAGVPASGKVITSDIPGSDFDVDNKLTRAKGIISSTPGYTSEAGKENKVIKKSVTLEAVKRNTAAQDFYENSPVGLNPENLETSPAHSVPVKKRQLHDFPASSDPVHNEDIKNKEADIELNDNTALEDGYEFITRAGGFFYLLNPLRGLLTPERLATQNEASVWRWLLDIYHLFTAKFPATAQVMDSPLHRFILQQLQPDASAHDLQQLAQLLKETPPGNFAQQLFSELELRYQHAAFWSELENSPGFFAVPARVVATSSHWDIYLPLQSVRLDLRLVGWDVNPGWLPWLGRVVALQYIDQPIISALEDKS